MWRGHRHGGRITRSKKRDTEEAVWLEFNNALVCHTWTGFVGQISMEGLRERERERGREEGRRETEMCRPNR